MKMTHGYGRKGGTWMLLVGAVMLAAALAACEKKKEAEKKDDDKSEKDKDKDGDKGKAGGDDVKKDEAGAKVDDKVGAGAGTATTAGSGTAATSGTTGGSVTGSGVLAELAGFKDAACACKDQACADGVMTKFQDSMVKYKDFKGTPEEAEQAGKIAEGLMECIMKVASADMGGGAPEPSTPPPVAAGDAPAWAKELPTCWAYVLAVEKFVSCDKVPAASRDATRQGVESMKQAWGQMAGLPADTIKQTEDACMQGMTGINDGAKALGCPI